MHIFPSIRQVGFTLMCSACLDKEEILSYRTSFEKYTYMSQAIGHRL